jgi:NitT/TauT family transport system ATP-binding protein
VNRAARDVQAAAAHVSLRGVTKVFVPAGGGPPVHAVGPLDLELKAGEFFAVVGPSGCGKSTLLELIAGLQRATAGEIVLEGRAIGGRIPDGVGIAAAWATRSASPTPISTTPPCTR